MPARHQTQIQGDAGARWAEYWVPRTIRAAPARQLGLDPYLERRYMPTETHVPYMLHPVDPVVPDETRVTFVDRES